MQQRGNLQVELRSPFPLSPYHLRMHADSQASRPQPPHGDIEVAVETFRILADGTRVRVLWALIDGERSVNELAEAVGKPPASVSQHLAKLRLSRTVATRREGNQVFYRLESDHVARLVTDAIHNAEHSNPGVPDHHLPGGGMGQLNRQAKDS